MRFYLIVGGLFRNYSIYSFNLFYIFDFVLTKSESYQKKQSFSKEKEKQT